MPTCRFLLLFSLIWARLVALDVFIDPVTGFRKIAAIRVSFQPDSSDGTTGDGTFLLEPDTAFCGKYTIDRPPHDKSYFESQLQAVDSYFRNVSNGHYGIDLDSSQVFPDGEAASYLLDHTMDYYHPYGETNEIYEQKHVELFRDALTVADSIDGISQLPGFDQYLIIVFHAGVGQEINWPFLDPTPEDIPSTYVDSVMLGPPIFGVVKHGIILPETQNNLLFVEETEDIFTDPSEYCDAQLGLTGIFAHMIGFSQGLPPLFNIQNGESRIGVFGLMDQGSNNGRGIIPSPPDAWTRIHAGWTTPTTIKPTTEVNLPARSTQDSIIKILIDDDEYFLIENRNNWFREGVSVDSAQYAIYDNTNDYPDYVEVLFDSVDIEFDENGVVTSISSYDLGLPASGLLIWHIDESIIRTAPDEYSINADRELRGVSLEESDGAVDIGFESYDLFNDEHTRGYFGDMWFDGNLQYEMVNGVGPPEFGPYSYPNTKSNDGASTFLSIENISVPGDTMSFTVSNTFLMDGFPDTTAFIRTVYDLNGDGVNEVFGGKDSLWWASSDDLSESNRIYFYDELDMDNIFIGLDQQNDSIIVSVDSPNFVVYDTNGTQISLDVEKWENHKNTVFGSFGALDSISLEDINVTWTEKTFDYIAGIDIDLDASLDVLALSSDGFLYCLNSDLILMAGFPLDIQLQPPILSRDLIDDHYPEIVARSADSTSLYVFDYQGRIQYQFASRKDDELVALENIDEKNSILTRFSIYQLGNSTETKGNEWAFEHGDWGRSRTVSLNDSVDFSSKNLLTRAYCYPNPIRDNKGTIRVESVDSEKIEIKLYDLAGYYITTFSKDSFHYGNQISEWIWDVSDVESGVYFAHVDVSRSSKTETKIIRVAVIH